MDAAFTQVIRLARRKNYAAAIKILNAEAFTYNSRGDWRFPYVMGLCYLKSGDAGSSFALLKRAADMSDAARGSADAPAHKGAEPFLALAALYLRRGETSKAIPLYLHVRDIDEKNKTAKKALNLLKNTSLKFDERSAVSLYPPFPRVPPSKKSIALALSSIVLAGLLTTGGVLLERGVVKMPSFEKETRDGFKEAALSAEEAKFPIDNEKTGDVRYILTAEEARESYEKGRSLFNRYHDEGARVEFNRVLLSNAAESLKNNARVLLSKMEEADWTTLKDRFSYADVKRDPLLYENCAVIWRGRASNLEQQDGYITFDLLVGYDTSVKFEGVVDVRFDFAFNLNTEKAVEVLGKVAPASNHADFTLVGVALHEIR